MVNNTNTQNHRLPQRLEYGDSVFGSIGYHFLSKFLYTYVYINICIVLCVYIVYDSKNTAAYNQSNKFYIQSRTCSRSNMHFIRFLMQEAGTEIIQIKFRKNTLIFLFESSTPANVLNHSASHNGHLLTIAQINRLLGTYGLESKFHPLKCLKNEGGSLMRQVQPR